MQIKTLLGAGAAAGVFAAMLATGAGPAAAADGGCLDYAANGWSIGVCSSDNGVRVSGDVYVNARGSLGSACGVNFGIYDLTLGRYMTTTATPCTLGRTPELHTTKVAGHRYQTIAAVVVNGATRVSGRSKITT